MSSEPALEAVGSKAPTIFISYRREDSAPHAARLHAALVDRYSRSNVFMDVRGIPAGDDYPQALDAALARCDALLVLIGQRWVGAKDIAGRARLEDSADWVLREVKSGLDRSIRVIPVLLPPALMPVANELPDAIQALARHQAVVLREDAWEADVARLVAQLEGRAEALAATPTNLVPLATAFFGRETEIARIGDLIRNGRLTTLTGAGGVGKTRLATEVGLTTLQHFPDGVFLVELESIADEGLVIPEIATALGLRELAGQSVEDVLATHLRHRLTLLVIDNFEHVAGAAPVLGRLLSATRQLRILVTSRVPLRLQAEQIFAVEPLDLPSVGASPSSYEESPATRLFVDRARTIGSGLGVSQVSQDDSAIIARICRMLDGLPLAIELAAVRTRSLGLRELEARLQQRLPLLTGGARDVPERQQTLTATIAWSHDLLRPVERTAFRRISVFAGGCTLEAAELVLPGSPDLAPHQVLPTLEALIAHSLARLDTPGGAARYRLLETVREYAAAKLMENDEHDAIAERHAAWVAGFASAADDAVQSTDQAHILQTMEAEHDNARAALTWAASRDAGTFGLELAIELAWFWEHRGHLTEGMAWLDRFLGEESDAPIQTRARALDAAGRLHIAHADYEAAIRRLEESLELRRQIADSRSIGVGLVNLGVALRDQGEPDKAEPFLREALAIFRETNDLQGASAALTDLGLVARSRGELDEAEACYRESLEIDRRNGDWLGAAIILNNLGLLELMRGSTDHAREHLLESLTLKRPLNDDISDAHGLEGLAQVALADGSFEVAARLLAAADVRRERAESPLAPADEGPILAARAALRQKLAPDDLAAAMTEGIAMSVDDAIELAAAGGQMPE